MTTMGQESNNPQNSQIIHSPSQPSQNGYGSDWEQKFRSGAWLLYKQYCEDFGQDLFERAEFYADRRKDRLIIKSDVDRALIDLEEERHNTDLLKRGADALAGIFIGISGSGFIAELYSGPTSWFIIYVAFLVAAFMLILWNYHRR